MTGFPLELPLFLLKAIGILILGLIAWVVLFLAWNSVRQALAVRRFRSTWTARGKDLLLVYSNSPHWQGYVEEHWLPRWGQRAVILNWSERNSWTRPASPEVALFRAFAGSREYNPLGIVVPPAERDVHVVRFWQAFRDRKHGRDQPLKEAEAELDDFLNGKHGLGRLK
jgi:hypothetical protein